MQNEITVSPLVDILSEQLGEQVFMSGEKYVYHAGLLPVEQSLVEEALLEQSSLFFSEYKANKIALIDSATKASIIDLAGSLENQANFQAKASQLAIKEIRGTITQAESTKLGELEALYATIEDLVIAGNDKEAQVSALVLTDFASLEEAISAVDAV